MEIELVTRSADAVDGRPELLFVHGAFHTARCWDEYFLPWFAAAGWTSHALSLRGHGASEGRERLQQATLEDYLDDVQAAMERIGRPVVLIGHSMGGVLVETLRERLPDAEAIAGTVLLACSPLRPSRAVALRLVLGSPVHVLRGLRRRDPRLLRPAFTRFFFPRRLDPELKRRFVAQLDGESMRAMDEVFARAPARPRADDDRPMLVVGGADDWSIPRRDHERLARVHDAPLEIVPGHHDLMLDPSWRRTAEAIAAWLERSFRANRRTPIAAAR